MNRIVFLINTVVSSGVQTAKDVAFKILRQPNEHFSDKQIHLPPKIRLLEEIIHTITSHVSKLN